MHKWQRKRITVLYQNLKTISNVQQIKSCTLSHWNVQKEISHDFLYIMVFDFINPVHGQAKNQQSWTVT